MPWILRDLSTKSRHKNLLGRERSVDRGMVFKAARHSLRNLDWLCGLALKYKIIFKAFHFFFMFTQLCTGFGIPNSLKNHFVFILGFRIFCNKYYLCIYFFVQVSTDGCHFLHSCAVFSCFFNLILIYSIRFQDPQYLSSITFALLRIHWYMYVSIGTIIDLNTNIIRNNS